MTFFLKRIIIGIFILIQYGFIQNIYYVSQTPNVVKKQFLTSDDKMRTIVGQTVNDTLSGVFKIYNSNKKLIEKISLSHGFLHGERIQYSLRNTKTVFSYRFGCLDTLTKYIGNKPILKYINRNCKEFKFITFKNGLPIDTAITDSNKKESQKVGYISNIKQLL